MSSYMEIHTTQPLEIVKTCFDKRRIGPFSLTPPTQKTSTRWGGEWKLGVYSIRSLDEDDRDDLHERFHLPRTLKTRIWITTDEVYEGQTDVYHMTAILLKEWEGDLALLNNGDYLEVQRLSGKISLRDDCLNPERLVFFRDFDWKPLPIVDE